MWTSSHPADEEAMSLWSAQSTLWRESGPRQNRLLTHIWRPAASLSKKALGAPFKKQLGSLVICFQNLLCSLSVVKRSFHNSEFVCDLDSYS